MTAANEIHITRIYDAPVQAVWDAWTDPKQTAQWWGPRGFTLTTHSKELKVGGIWHYTMHGPDGTDYPNKTLYHEVLPRQKLVYDHGGNDERAPLFRVTVLFSEQAGKTTMNMTMTLPTAEEAAQTREFIRKAGGNATWDRLAEYLGGSKPMFVINRSFDAPLDVMFDMWTNPEHVAQWAAPTGSTMHYTKADIRSGGSSSYSMTGGMMGVLYGKANYITIQKPDLLVYTQQFTDAQGNVARHPMAPTWPETMITTVRFIAEGPTQTRVNLTWEPYGGVTEEEIATFLQARAGMTMGWTGSFDKLEAKLAEDVGKRKAG